MRTLLEVQNDIAEVRQALSRARGAIEQKGSGGRSVRRAELSELRADLKDLLAEEAAYLNGGRSHSFRTVRVRGGW